MDKLAILRSITFGQRVAEEETDVLSTTSSKRITGSVSIAVISTLSTDQRVLGRARSTRYSYRKAQSSSIEARYW